MQSKLNRYLFFITQSRQKADEAEKKFSLYKQYLLKQNEFFNLTSITDEEEIDEKHFIDSLVALPYIKGTVADIGSGAGFPGIPLKIMLPASSFTLIDCLRKRVNFMQEVFSLLQMEDIRTIHSRAEDLNKKEQYDTVVSRAVSRLATLSEYCIPFVKKGGIFIAYKANDCEEEIKEAQYAVSVLGGIIEKTETVNLFETDIKRKLIFIKKIKDTPDIYPRGQNKPRKQPLLQ